MNPANMVGLMGILGFILWVASVAVVVNDAKERKLNHVTWGVLTFFLPILGLLLYALINGSSKAWGMLCLIITLNVGLYLYMTGKLTDLANPPKQQVISDGKMLPVANSGVEAIIDVDPNSGKIGTPVKVTIKFTSGAEKVANVKMYSLKELTSWDYAFQEFAYAPTKTAPDIWHQGDLIYTYNGPAVLRFYALTTDGRALAVGDINKDGGGPAISSDKDGVADEPYPPGGGINIPGGGVETQTEGQATKPIAPVQPSQPVTPSTPTPPPPAPKLTIVQRTFSNIHLGHKTVGSYTCHYKPDSIVIEPRSVEVVIEGDINSFANLPSLKGSLYVEIVQPDDGGIRTLPVIMSPLPNGVRLIRINPSSVKVTIEPEVTKTYTNVPVKIRGVMWSEHDARFQYYVTCPMTVTVKLKGCGTEFKSNKYLTQGNIYMFVELRDDPHSKLDSQYHLPVHWPGLALVSPVSIEPGFIDITVVKSQDRISGQCYVSGKEASK